MRKFQAGISRGSYAATLFVALSITHYSFCAMFSRLQSASTFGVSAFVVEIETHLENGLPAFVIVGLPDSAVREARERVSAAIKNSRLVFPQKKITVNLAPADVRKEGSGFDLPIAIGILTALGVIPPESTERTMILGELALDGTLRPVRGALPVAMEAKKQGFTRLLLPAVNADEAAMVASAMPSLTASSLGASSANLSPQHFEVIPLESLRHAADILSGEQPAVCRSVDAQTLFHQHGVHLLDWSEVKGQENVKRALEVAAAGGHNVIMVGSPGSGKTMIAKRLPTILPPLSLEESLETTKIHSVAGTMPDGQPLITVRPFRAPHHTISDAALVGGGVGAVRPGEISLAHHGVLFLDELPEFARNVLEVLRQPLEDRRITISRTKMTVEYPANFMLVCSMNPCPCGNFGNPNQACTCSPQQIQRYMAKVSGPLLDRIDIHVDVAPVQYQELSSAQTGESSDAVRARVLKAREIQKRRFAGRAASGVHKNADMTSKDLRAFCRLDAQGEALMKTAMTKVGLSARAFDRILKVARTIADLADREQMLPQHISEAIQYRSLDRQFWNA
jgi:magnesium chelatase family protein